MAENQAGRFGQEHRFWVSAGAELYAPTFLLQESGSLEVDLSNAEFSQVSITMVECVCGKQFDTLASANAHFQSFLKTEGEFGDLPGEHARIVYRRPDGTLTEISGKVWRKSITTDLFVISHPEKSDREYIFTEDTVEIVEKKEDEEEAEVLESYPCVGFQSVQE